MSDDIEPDRHTDLMWWSTAGSSTDLSAFAERLSGLPTSPSELYTVVQGLVIHALAMADRGVVVADRQVCNDDATAADVLNTALDLRDGPLDAPRPLSERAVGACFHSAVLYSAFLRAHGTPARARCGFARYLIPELWTCHWIVERWDEGWIQDDPDVNRRALGPDEFQSGVDAWRACRRGDDDPDSYGLPGSTGWVELQGSVVCDLAALAKIERFQYSAWPLAHASPLRPAEARWLDELATAAAAGDLGSLRGAAAGGFPRRK